DRQKDHLQVASVRADVADREAPVGAELLLEREVPLLHKAVPEVAWEAARAAIEPGIEIVRSNGLREGIYRGIIERRNHLSRRTRPISVANDRWRIRSGAIEARTIVEAGVRRNVGYAVASPHHRRLRELVSSAQPRTKVVIARMPHVAVGAVVSGKDDGPAGVEQRLPAREIDGTEPVVALGRTGLHIPTQPEVERQPVSSAPVVLAVERVVLLRQRQTQLEARSHAQVPGAQQQRRHTQAVVRGV